MSDGTINGLDDDALVFGEGPAPRPWMIVEHEESFEIRDAAGDTVTYIYFEDEPLRRSVSGRVTKAEARAEAEALLRISLT